MKLLEDVQRRSTKLVKGLQGVEYEERAQLLNLDSLSCRMDKGDMILVYKILHGFLEGVQWQLGKRSFLCDSDKNILSFSL